jgi:2-polyprenyl-3-methyl-5-hydroxy-6-metoxy-1,4-benzoquinol methylase
MDAQEKLAYVAKKAGYSSLERYVLRSKFIFEGMDFKNKRILEIGCGKGAFCMWAGLQGAEYVLGIEPEADGRIEGSMAVFQDLLQKLNLNNVESKNCFLQSLSVPNKKYDIILMFNVINHLDEKAVEILHKDKTAVEAYIKILRDLKNYLNPDGLVIVADCARSNFWNTLGLKSPFVPTIEWHKHQNPRRWIDIFSQSGYCLYDFRWSSLHPIGKLASNFIVQYLTTSHFVLRFQNK